MKPKKIRYSISAWITTTDGDPKMDGDDYEITSFPISEDWKDYSPECQDEYLGSIMDQLITSLKENPIYGDKNKYTI